MAKGPVTLIFLAFCSTSLCARPAFKSHLLQGLAAQGANLWKLHSIAETTQKLDHHLVIQDSHLHPPKETPVFVPQWFTQPLDHFSDSPDTFRQRFWVNARHYQPNVGGPVYVLDGGETSGEERLPFLDTGIMEILAKATGGVSVILEHRYYGT